MTSRSQRWLKRAARTVRAYRALVREVALLARQVGAIACIVWVLARGLVGGGFDDLLELLVSLRSG